MKFSLEALGLFVVVPLFAAGLWLIPADDRTDRHSPSSDGVPAHRVSMSCVNQVDWSDDGEKLFVRYRGGNSSETRLGFVDQAGNVSCVPFDNVGLDIANTAALSADARHVLIGTILGRVWNVDGLSETANRLLVDLRESCSITSIAVTQDEKLIAVGAANGVILLRDVHNSSEERRMWPSTAESRSAIGLLKFSPDGRRLLAARNDGRLELYCTSTNRLLQNFPGHHSVVKGIAFLADGGQIISAGLDDSVRIWDVESGREVWRGDFGLEGIHALDVSRDGRLAAWGGSSRRIVLWDFETGARRCQIDSGLPVVFDVRFSRDGKQLAVVGHGAGIQLYDTESGLRSKSLAVDVR